MDKRRRVAERLLLAERAYRAAQARLDGSDESRARYVAARAELEVAEEAAVRALLEKHHRLGVPPTAE